MRVSCESVPRRRRQSRVIAPIPAIRRRTRICVLRFRRIGLRPKITRTSDLREDVVVAGGGMVPMDYGVNGAEAPPSVIDAAADADPRGAACAGGAADRTVP